MHNIASIFFNGIRPTPPCVVMVMCPFPTSLFPSLFLSFFSFSKVREVRSFLLRSDTGRVGVTWRSGVEGALERGVEGGGKTQAGSRRRSKGLKCGKGKKRKFYF